MRAMLLRQPKAPLTLEEVPVPSCGDDEVLVKVRACALCRTDLHVYDGELTQPKLPLILGHQVVGIVEQTGKTVKRFKRGDRVGLPWLANACGHCGFCLTSRENLCQEALFRGYQLNGGFAEYCLGKEAFTFLIPDRYSDVEAAPLLCAGLIGYRAYRLAGSFQTIGFFGFGSAAHILLQVALFEGKSVYAFTKEGDEKGARAALKRGCIYAGSSLQKPPCSLDAAIVFASDGSLVPLALQAVGPGGTVVTAGIFMSDIPAFPYASLWEERCLRSVANLTRQDGIDFLKLAPRIPVKTEVKVYPLEQTNEALAEARRGGKDGALVITPLPYF